MLSAQRMLDLAPVGVIQQDAQAEIRYANDAAMRLLGTSRDALLGRTSYDPRWRVVRADGTPFPAEEHPAPVALATGEPQRDVVMGIYRPRTADWVWLRVDAVPDKDADGEVTGCVVTFADISPEIAARVEAEGLYQATLAAMSEGVVVHAGDGCIRFANQAATAALGLTDEQLRGRDPTDPGWGLVKADGTPLDPSEIPSEITRNTGKPLRERRVGVRSGSGELRWLSVSTDPIGDAPPEAVPVVATFEDITAALALQQRITREQERFARVADAVPGLIFQLLEPPRASGEVPRYTYLSGRCEDIAGVPAETLQRDARYLIRERLHPEDRPRVIEAWKQARAADQPVEFDCRLLPVDDDRPDVSWVRVRAIPHRRDGAVEWHGMVLDVTDQYGLADSLRRAQRLQSISRMAAGIAHNFNNALQAILPNLEIALDQAPPELREPLTDARASARSASQLVEQLLLAARGESRAADRAQDLAAITRSVVRLCRSTFGASVVLRCTAEPSPVPVRMERVHVEQVLLNLLINARDAVSEVANPEITVELATHEGQAILVVEDNGSGMDADTLASLGEPFFTTKGITGHGLGLATVYGVLREHEGTVDVQSTPGEGTRFVLTLPLTRDLAPPDSEGPAALPARRGLHILVVDDQPLVARAAARTLSRLGHDVTVANGGEAALELLETAFDAVIIDLSMPDLPGEKVLAAFRARHPALRLAILTGHDDGSIDLTAADAVLLKPVERDDLVAFLDGVPSPA